VYKGMALKNEFSILEIIGQDYENAIKTGGEHCEKVAVRYFQRV